MANKITKFNVRLNPIHIIDEYGNYQLCNFHSLYWDALNAPSDIEKQIFDFFKTYCNDYYNSIYVAVEYMVDDVAKYCSYLVRPCPMSSTIADSRYSNVQIVTEYTTLQSKKPLLISNSYNVCSTVYGNVLSSVMDNIEGNVHHWRFSLLTDDNKKLIRKFYDMFPYIKPNQR